MKTQAALAAKAIKQELKKAFPNTKFQVRSENFSMGNAVNINWDNGPTVAQVDSITDKYQYGHFDGMIDCYETSNRRDDIPQAKFVQTQRNLTDEVREKIWADLNTQCECFKGKTRSDYIDGFMGGCWGDNAIYHQSVNMAL